MIEAEKFEDIFVEWVKASLDKKRGLTQAGLAAHLNIAHPQITALLKGKRAIKVRELPKIAEYFGVDPPFFAPLEENFDQFLEQYRKAGEQDRDRALRQAMTALNEDPAKEGEVIDLLRLINDNNRDQAIRVLRALAETG